MRAQSLSPPPASCNPTAQVLAHRCLLCSFIFCYSKCPAANVEELVWCLCLGQTGIRGAGSWCPGWASQPLQTGRFTPRACCLQLLCNSSLSRWFSEIKALLSQPLMPHLGNAWSHRKHIQPRQGVNTQPYFCWIRTRAWSPEGNQ